MPNELEDLPAAVVSPLPPFDKDGLLPAGDYFPTADAFTSHFVTLNDQRREIYSGWNQHRLALIEDGLATDCRELLNGSYTTFESEPGDIDIAVEVRVSSNDLRSLADDAPVVRLLLGSRMKVNYSCDAYPIYCLPADDPYYHQVTAAAIRYWTKWFGTTRDGKPKGRVWATLRGFQ